MVWSRMDELNERFEEFHSQNPRFYNLFNSFTYHLIGKGFRNYSAKCIFERIRWETDQANSEGQSDFKVNNNFASFYSRLWMEKNQKYSGFFRIRAQPSADKDPTKLPELKPNDFPTE